MFTVNIEMYGIPQNIFKENKLAVELNNSARLKDIVASLKQKVPLLEGPVIRQGQDRLIDNYAFIVNGQFQLADADIRIQPNDRIVLVLLATGG